MKMTTNCIWTSPSNILFVKGSPYIRHFDRNLEVLRQSGLFYLNIAYDINNLMVQGRREVKEKNNQNNIISFKSFKPFLKFIIISHIVSSTVFSTELFLHRFGLTRKIAFIFSCNNC